MTEAEWATCTNPKDMLAWLANRQAASERKLRLFSCACLRRVWHGLADPRGREAVEVAERFADGNASDEEREAAQVQAARGRQWGATAAKWAVAAVARTGAIMTVDVAGQTAACLPGQEYDPQRWVAEWHGQCELLRDVFGPLPFRSITVAPAWRTPAVLEIAQATYEGREFDRILQLGQALLQAGCDDREILHHCVWPSQHVRGCWVVDALLGKT